MPRENWLRVGLEMDLYVYLEFRLKFGRSRWLRVWVETFYLAG
jgi:hypothetical protein